MASAALLGLSPTFFQANPGIAAQVMRLGLVFPGSFNQNTASRSSPETSTPNNSFAELIISGDIASPHGYSTPRLQPVEGLALTDATQPIFFQF